jgi:hypothetical protein
MQGHMWYNASETKWDTHQWTLEDEDRTCERNAMDPREARSSACQNTKNARMRNPRDMWVRELRTVWDREMCIIREMHENARNLKREMHKRRENTRCAKYAKCAKTRDARKRENTKIAALQQVQYKVLLYGLYAPIETWVSTAHWQVIWEQRWTRIWQIMRWHKMWQ